jgi:hypothetical protein
MRELIAAAQQTFYNYIQSFEIEDYSLLMVYKQFIVREQMITDILNSAHHAGQIAKNIVWVPQVYEK